MRNTGADINQEGEGSTTPLHMAAQAGHTSLVERMVSWGADVDIKDISGATPLRLAQSFGHKPGWMLNSQGRWNLLQEFAAGLYYRTYYKLAHKGRCAFPTVSAVGIYYRNLLQKFTTGLCYTLAHKGRCDCPTVSAAGISVYL